AAEAESLVEFAYEPPHPFHARHVAGFPLAELSRRRISLRQPLGDAIGSHLSRSEGEQDAGGIERIEEAEGVPHERPTVAGSLTSPIRVFLLSAENIAALGVGDPRLHAGATRHFLEVNALEIGRLTILEQVIVSGHHTHADDVVVQRNVPEPALFLF